MKFWTMSLLLVWLFPVFASQHQFPVKPNPEITTGKYCDESDPDFVGYRYKERIPYCQRRVERETKARVYAAYGVADRCRREYTVDHYIPLSMGGSNATHNLWPEHRNIKATRQNLEQEVFERLAEGQITQRQAVEAITASKLNPPPDITPGCF